MEEAVSMQVVQVLMDSLAIFKRNLETWSDLKGDIVNVRMTKIRVKKYFDQ